jgi:hypothetical protein
MDYIVLIMVNNYSYIISTIMILTVIVIASVQEQFFLVNPLMTQSHGDGWDLWMCIQRASSLTQEKHGKHHPYIYT